MILRYFVHPYAKFISHLLNIFILVVIELVLDEENAYWFLTPSPLASLCSILQVNAGCEVFVQVQLVIQFFWITTLRFVPEKRNPQKSFMLKVLPCPILPGIRKGTALLMISQASHACPSDTSSIKMKMSMQHWLNDADRKKILEENPVSVPLFPPKIQHGLYVQRPAATNS
jgi:hypothetical protein